MGKLQDLIKRKCDKIKNTNIEAKIFKEENVTIIDIYIDDIIEPQMRHRDRRGKGKYDPLGEYKKILKDKVFNLINIEPTSKPVEMDIIYCMPPTGLTKVGTLQAMSGLLLPTKKPDIDNVMKLVQDTFNKYIYEDDSQITGASYKKIYTSKPMTYIRFTVLEDMNKEIEKGLRLNKEMKEYYETLINKRKIGW